MKKFLKDLEKELKKLKISDEEIAEILADHAEMIESAINDGVSEQELSDKFGDPAKVAKELKNDNLTRDRNIDNNKDYSEVVEVKGYDLFKAFNVLDDGYSVHVNLVSEDVKFYVYDGEQIEVFAKGDTEKYNAEYKNKHFSLSVQRGIKLFGFRKTTRFVIRLPKGMAVDEFNYNNTSGDAELYGLSLNEAKLNAVSGDFELYDISAKNAIINTVSGDAEMKNISCDTLHLRSVSGDFEVENMTVTDDLKLKSVSGDFEINNAESGVTRLDSVSGDLDGDEFYPSEISMKTISGDVTINNTDSMKAIKVTGKKSMSGDIKINGSISE